MRRSLILILVLALVGVIAGAVPGGAAPGNGRGPKPKPTPSPSPSPTPPPVDTDTTCSNYSETRQFVEAQGWWVQTPGKDGDDFGHIHAGACIPERETISGTIPLHVRVILHDNPGTLRYVGIVVKGAGYETTVAKLTAPNFTCPVGTCTKWLSYNLDTKAFENSGRQEIRLRTIVDEPTGNTMHAGLNFQVVVDNGRPLSNYAREPYLRGKGFYTTAGYCEATYQSVPIPDVPVSGTWTPTVAMIEHETGTVNAPVSHHTVRIDPDFHAGFGGIVVEDGDKTFQGQLSIDTTTLSNGAHRLVLRSDCDHSSGSTNAGVLVVPFTVQN